MLFLKKILPVIGTIALMPRLGQQILKYLMEEVKSV